MRTAFSASSQMAKSRLRRENAPKASGTETAMRRASKRSASKSSSERIALSRATMEPAAGISPLMSPEPTHARRSKTSFSRSGSIGGFVTCAKRSRRYSAMGVRRSKNASAASSPIESVGSFAVASTPMTSLSSSRVQPKRCRAAFVSPPAIGSTRSCSGKPQLRTTSRKSARSRRSLRNCSVVTTSPEAKRTMRRPPGPRRPRSTTASSPKSTIPASEAHSTLLLAVRHQRSGRNPVRSRAAPIVSPSANTMAAGPSHGSTVGTCAS